MSKISELSDGGSLLASDYLIVVRSGGNVKVRLTSLDVNQIDLDDNEFIRLGNSQDLTLVHDTSNSIINQAGIGNLLIQKAGVTKLTINASGIDVTGSVTADGLTVDGGGSLTFSELTSKIIGPLNQDFILQQRGNADTEALRIQNVDNNNLAKFDKNGNVSLYEDTGTTPKFVWDASAESLGVGTDPSSYGNTIVADQGGNYTGFNDQAGLLIRASSGTTGDGQHHGAISFSKGTGQAAISGVQEGSDADVLGLAFWTHSSSTGSAAAEERMRIDGATGNVGIGTASPSSVTHLVDDTSTVYDATAYQSDLTIERKNTSGSNQSAHIRFNVTGYEGSTTGEASIGAVQTANASSADLVFTTRNAGTRGERMRIDASGHAIIPAGVTLGTAVGVYNAANTLDDYEEGTFTPVIADAATGGNSGSYTTAEGFYTKIGQIVHVYMFVSNIVTTGMTAANLIYFRGLPFTTASTNAGRSQGSIRADLVTFTGYLTAQTGTNVSYVTISNIVSGNNDIVTKVQDLTSGGADVFISLTYRTA